MSTLRSARRAVAGASVALALLVSGCTIGDVGDRGSDGTDGTDGTGATTAPGTPEPTSPSAPSSPSAPASDAPQPGGTLEVPEDAGSVGVALLDGGELRTGGSLAGRQDASDPAVTAAWSTIKVPLAVAALRGDPGLTAQMQQAVTASDNAAADALWSSLGTPEQAASAVQGVLAEAGDTQTTVPAEKRRAEFSTFGQTDWTLEAQTTFARGLQCLDGAGPVLDAMGQVVAGQDYGLGRFDGALFKGGWGPSDDGSYLVRQFGLVPADDGTLVPVAVSATAADGSYESAQGVLDRVVDELHDTVTGAHGVPDGGDCSD